MKQLQTLVHDLEGVAYTLSPGEPMTRARFRRWLTDNGMRILPGTPLPDGQIEGDIEIIPAKLWGLWQCQSCRRALFFPWW